MRRSRPRIVTVSGSTRFAEETREVIAHLEMLGVAVFSVGSFMHAEGLKFSESTKRRLDELHLAKISMSDAVFVVNVGGYIGESTRREIAFAESLGIPVEYLESEVESC